MSFGGFLEARLGLRRALGEMLEHPIAGGPSWASAIGFTLAFLLFLLGVTGAALMTTYAPSVEAAWASVHYTSIVVPHGWLLRGLHRFAGEGMLVLAVAHVAMLAMGGGHRAPREIGYVAAVLLVAAVFAACITGGVLPWDQHGYWARRVELSIASTGPGGIELTRLVQGGDDFGQLALTRMYAAHVVVVPLVILSLLWLRRRSETGHGATIAARHNHGYEPYSPRQLARDLALAACAVLVLGWLTNKLHGAPLDAPADPRIDYPARPEWYLLWMYELRHRMPHAYEFWGTAGVPLALGAVFALLPWLGRRKIGISPIGTLLVVASLGLVGWLSYSQIQRDRADVPFQKARKKAAKRAVDAIAIARGGVPPAGPLVMLDHDPQLRGEALFAEHCASCHRLGDLGEKSKDKRLEKAPANAPRLDGWGTQTWILAMLHNPDGAERFGNTPYRERMPSMDTPPKQIDPEHPFKPMTEDAMHSVAAFLSEQGAEPGDGFVAAANDVLDAGEKIVRDRCTACHLYRGTGDDNGDVIAPELASYGSVAWVRAQITDPSSKATYRENALDPEMKHHMPKFDGELSVEDIELLARWTRAKARSVP